VRATIEQNFDQLRDVLATYGLKMDRAVARRRAQRARAEQGWKGQAQTEPPEEENVLRLVGGQRA